MKDKNNQKEAEKENKAKATQNPKEKAAGEDTDIISTKDTAADRNREFGIIDNEHLPEKKSKRLILFMRKIYECVISTKMTAHSGESAFFFILSFFPFIMLLCTLLRFTSLTPETMYESVKIIFPRSFSDILHGIILEIYKKRSATIVSINLIFALWLGSQAFMSIINGLNDMYQIKETRNYIFSRAAAIVYTAIFAVLIIATLTFMVYGDTLYTHFSKKFPAFDSAFRSIINMRYTVCAIFMILFFTIMYCVVPNQRVGILAQLPGALIATTGWMGFSYLYSYYIENMNTYNVLYGTMTTIALLMVWLYACMFIIYFGGLINHLLAEFARPDRKKNKT